MGSGRYIQGGRYPQGDRYTHRVGILNPWYGHLMVVTEMGGMHCTGM